MLATLIHGVNFQQIPLMQVFETPRDLLHGPNRDWEIGYEKPAARSLWLIFSVLPFVTFMHLD